VNGASLSYSRGPGFRQCVGLETTFLAYELIYQLDAIEYLFVYYQLDMFRAYTPIFKSNGCYNFFTYTAYGVLGVVRCWSCGHATSTHTPQDRHL